MTDTATVTVLFTDVVGSTALTQRIGDCRDLRWSGLYYRIYILEVGDTVDQLGK
jgi:class 3 adenylate cyclase